MTLMINKQYYNIKEVSKLLNLKEHVIRHWDSVDPKTKKLTQIMLRRIP